MLNRGIDYITTQWFTGRWIAQLFKGAVLYSGLKGLMYIVLWFKGGTLCSGLRREEMHNALRGDWLNSGLKGDGLHNALQRD